ncbi:Hsp70 family protein [Kibdelosporangium aridum]|uniref:hypothetical protein n=1 Tax=Kibdelosporangium aridum TaxID=2030 RepID=UPI001179C669|nr:hypothetical protein [Kibdelosporangium aridum]
MPLADIYRRLGDAVERDIDEFDVDRGAERLAAWMQAPADAEPVPDLSATALSSRAIGVKAVDSQDPLAVDNPIRAKAIIVHLLSANTPLPADSGPYPFSTAVRNQRLLEIEIWEQTGPVESSDVEHNIQIGRGVLRLPPGLPAHSSIEITFSLSEAGTLGVHAVEPNSGAQGRFELQIGETVAAVRADIVGVELK